MLRSDADAPKPPAYPFIHRALELSSPYFAEDGNFGRMNPTRVRAFLEWLVEKNLEKSVILNQELFTNSLVG